LQKQIIIYMFAKSSKRQIFTINYINLNRNKMKKA
jgi:acyl-[acyl carrier protein]--UDP-N-acetylglucosamine O-acyltransferase